MIIINKKIVISWILVILWLGLIFYMSSMNSDESNNKSKSTINNIIEKSVNATNELGITDKHPNENKKEQVIELLNHPLRKVMHSSEYLILALLIIHALISSGISGKKIYLFCILICFIYACTDEYHQIFIIGRTGQFTDVLIDTFGGFLGCILVIIKDKILKYKDIKQIIHSSK